MRFHKVVMWALAFALVISALYVLPYARHAQQSNAQTIPDAQGMASPELASWRMPLPARRAVYPLSVIPGGVESVAELKQIIRGDPEIAHHLKDFDVNKTRLVRITQPQAAYVSYRIGDHIFWTAKKLTLRKGELVLTDGTHIIRGRCGNDVSYVPMRPIAPGLELTPAQLDTPLLSPDEPLLLPDSAFFLAYSSSLGTPRVPPIGASPIEVGPIDSAFFPIFSPGGVPGTEPIPAPTPTPEPVPVLLLSTAGIVFGVQRLLLKSRSARQHCL
jgi:hypothetical protein